MTIAQCSAQHRSRVAILREALGAGDAQERALALEMLHTWGDENMRVPPLPFDQHVERLKVWQSIESDPLATEWDKKIAARFMQQRQLAMAGAA